VSVTTEAGSTKMRDRSTFTPGATDETAEYLDANGWTLLDGTNGERYIRCPFEDGHSTGGDPTSTVYFPAGTAGLTSAISSACTPAAPIATTVIT
jgi:hypothetical protein